MKTPIDSVEVYAHRRSHVTLEEHSSLMIRRASKSPLFNPAWYSLKSGFALFASSSIRDFAISNSSAKVIKTSNQRVDRMRKAALCSLIVLRRTGHTSRSTNEMNMFSLFTLFSLIAGGVGANLAAKSNSTPENIFLILFGIVIGFVVHFGTLKISIMLTKPRNTGNNSVSGYALFSGLLIVTLLPVLSGVSAYWTITTIWK